MMRSLSILLSISSVFLFIHFLSGCGCEEDEGIIAELYEPSASFTYSPSPPHVEESITFDAGSSTDGDGVEAIYSDCKISLFSWNFGDGETAETDSYITTHSFSDVGEYEVSLTVYDERGGEAGTVEMVQVIHWPPEIYYADFGSDGVAVIGEIIEIHGINFREENTPEVIINGSTASHVKVLSDEVIEVRVPPKAVAGIGDMEVHFPEGEGDTKLEIEVVRYAVNLIPYNGLVQFLRAEDGSSFVYLKEVPIEDASIIKITGDGSTAYIGDGRWDINLHPTIAIVDMTHNGGPEIVDTITEIGSGPLYDIAFSKDASIGVISDSTGFTVIDIEDPLNPVVIGSGVVYSFVYSTGVGATDVEIFNDGSIIAALDPTSNNVYFYEVTSYGARELPYSIQTGDGAQDMLITEDGEYLFALSGGGEGAIPPDLNTGNTTLTLIDITGSVPANACGSGTFISLEGGIPIPWDMALNADGDTLYISTLDQNFSDISDAFSNIISDPTDYNAWIDLANAIMNLSFGSVTPVTSILSCSSNLLDPYYSSYGFQTGISVEYDESSYIASTIKLSAELNYEDILAIYASINISSGLTIGDISSGETSYIEFTSDPVLLFDLYSATFSYDLSPLINLFTPPYSYGDTAIQP